METSSEPCQGRALLQQACKHVRDARYCNKLASMSGTRAIATSCQACQGCALLQQAGKHVRDARYCNNMETRAVIKFYFFLQGKAPKEIHAILTETSDCFLPGRANNLSAPLYSSHSIHLPSSPVQCSYLHPTLHLLFVF